MISRITHRTIKILSEIQSGDRTSLKLTKAHDFVDTFLWKLFVTPTLPPSLLIPAPSFLVTSFISSFLLVAIVVEVAQLHASRDMWKSKWKWQINYQQNLSILHTMKVNKAITTKFRCELLFVQLVQSI